VVVVVLFPYDYQTYSVPARIMRGECIMKISYSYRQERSITTMWIEIKDLERECDCCFRRVAGREKTNE
jgi:hypothetical protein